MSNEENEEIDWKLYPYKMLSHTINEKENLLKKLKELHALIEEMDTLKNNAKAILTELQFITSLSIFKIENNDSGETENV